MTLSIDSILEKSEIIFKEVGCVLECGSEIEFFSSDLHKTQYLFKKNKEKFLTFGTYDDLFLEDGVGQAEIKFFPTRDIMSLVGSISSTKRALSNICANESVEIFWDAKPFPDKPGSGIHFHIGIKDIKSGKNMFSQDWRTSSPVALGALAGMLDHIEESLRFFAPSELSYSRYNGYGMTTPSNISWGPNNRTAALRFISLHNETTRVEHRVPCSDCMLHETIASIYAAAAIGAIENRVPKGPIYGIASDNKYYCHPFPSNLKNAQLIDYSIEKKILEIFAGKYEK